MRNVTDILIEKKLYSCCPNWQCKNKEIFINNTFAQPICPDCGELMASSFDRKKLQIVLVNIVPPIMHGKQEDVTDLWIKTGWDE